MTAVVLAGPLGVLGPGSVDAEAAAEALACIDDELALVGDEAVDVDDLWADVLRSAAGSDARAVVVVIPSWWSSRRMARIEAAARRAGLRVVVKRRSDALCRNTGHAVEVCEDIVVVHGPDRGMALLPRTGRTPRLVDDVCEHLRDAAAVVVDDPTGEVGPVIVERMRSRWIPVDVVDDETIWQAYSIRRLWIPRVGPRVALAAAATSMVVALCGAAVGRESTGDGPPSTTWLVEGRVTVEFPADWTAERVLDGPGSARVQITSPSGQVMHLTQSAIPSGQDLAAAAEVVHTALTGQPEGVFTGYRPAADVGGVSAITYRESRPGRRVDWTLVVDGSVRIAIGCQETDEVPAPVADCHRAVRTAREIG